LFKFVSSSISRASSDDPEIAGRPFAGGTKDWEQVIVW